MISANERMNKGLGASEESIVTATRPGKFPDDNTGGERSQGETSGAGSIYAATLAERPNISDPRNQGPDRTPSRTGDGKIPIAMMDTRNTGRVK